MVFPPVALPDGAVMPVVVVTPPHNVAMAAFTVTGIVASTILQPSIPAVYIILQVPADTPVTNPEPFTVAIPVLSLDQTPAPVTVLPEGNVLLTDGKGLLIHNVVVPPTVEVEDPLTPILNIDELIADDDVTAVLGQLPTGALATNERIWEVTGPVLVCTSFVEAVGALLPVQV
jgi:hypothetical protein